MTRKRRGGRSATVGASQRQLRVGEAIRQAVAELLLRGRVRDTDGSEVQALITEVRPSPDLRNATCFVRGQGHADAVAPLNRLAPVLGGEVGRMLRMKFAPRLSFVHDSSFDSARRIDDLLRRPDVARDLQDPD